MNIEQAKAIPIAYILDLLNLKPTRETTNESWYLSPFRDEKTASFKVHHKRNVWYDFGVGIGGDPINLVCSWLESRKQPHNVSDALQWLKASVDSANIKPVSFVPVVPSIAERPKLEIKSVRSIKQRALEHYLDSRGIPITIATRLLNEVRIHNYETGKNMFALGLKNEENGYEVRNPFFKGCIGPKHISFVRGKEAKSQGINLFEGFMDYLSMITQQNGQPFRNDSIILNSLSCLDLATPYIKGYGYTVAYTWMDNDDAGKRATQTLDAFFKTEEGLVHKPMNALYRSDKDVNDWHMRTLGLKANP